MWMAGGGVQGGPRRTARPTTSATTSPRTGVHVHDLHATLLHLLGIDHERLTYRLSGPRLPPDRRPRQDRPGPGSPERRCHRRAVREQLGANLRKDARYAVSRRRAASPSAVRPAPDLRKYRRAPRARSSESTRFLPGATRSGVGRRPRADAGASSQRFSGVGQIAAAIRN